MCFNIKSVPRWFPLGKSQVLDELAGLAKKKQEEKEEEEEEEEEKEEEEG